ncbi:MAG: radical SAM protein [Pelagibacterales bacterium]|nr:radical SAM protein [Pelagibacterales bacterium]
MLYKDSLHNFEKFIEDWNVETEYVLFGASKECVQFIRSMDILMGEGVLKIKYIVDHNVKDKDTLDNINEISTAYHESKVIQINRKGIKLVHIDNFNFDSQVIITTDVFKQKYKDYLENNNVKYTWYKNIASIWPYKHKNKVHIYQTDVLVTEKCTLACSYCNMFMPHYEFPIHRELNTIKSDIDSYFSIVDYVSVFHLVGGEPFLYPNIEDVVRYVITNYIHKIDKLIITTNGTIMPKDSLLELLRTNDVILSVSDYTDKLPHIQKKVLKVIKEYKNKKINHYVRNEIEWYDFGDLRIKVGRTEEELIKHFDSCTAPFRGLNDGKFYYCHLNTSAVRTNLFPLNDNDYVSINNVSKEDLIKFDLGFTNLGYVTFCDNCNGCNTGIKVPVSYEKQGLR